MDRLLALPKPKEEVLGLPSKITLSDCKLLYIGYISYIKTGRPKSEKRIAEDIAKKKKEEENSDIDNKETELIFEPCNNQKTREYDDSICYCFKCKKKINAIIRHNIILTSSSSYESNVKYYECPHCHQSVSEDHIFFPDYIYTVYRNYFLDGNKLKIKRKDYIFKIRNNSVFIQEYRYVHVMNLDTGYSYSLRPMKNGKLMKDTGIKNVTYQNCYNDSSHRNYSNKCKKYDDFYAEIYQVIRKYKMQKLNIYLPDYSVLNEKDKKHFKPFHIPYKKYITMQDIFKFNRFPTMNLKFADNFDVPKREKEIVKLRRSIKPDTKDPMKDILLYYNMPVTKINKKKLEISIHFPKFCSQLNKVINNYDIAMKFLNDCFLDRYYYFEIDTICECLEVIKDCKGFNINNFINKAIKDNNKYMMVDALRLARDIIRKSPDYKFNFKCSIRELHDTLTKDFNKLKHENEIIKYEDEVKVLEGKYGELYFNLAKDTHELIEVGTEMGICVGGYGDRAARKDLNIVIARDENNKPIICIEMCKDYFSLKQTKLKHNSSIEENTIEYTAIEAWAIANVLEFDTYYDIPDELHKRINDLEAVKKKRIKIARINRNKEKVQAVARAV